MSAFRSRLLLLTLHSPLLLPILRPKLAAGQSVVPTSKASLSGIVTDPTGAIIPNATVTLEREGQPAQTITTDATASYSFTALSAGTYSLTAVFDGFAARTVKDVVLTADQRRFINLALPLETQQQEVNVGPDGSALDPAHNGDATVLSGSALSTLSNNQSLMLQEIQGMGGSAGDSGGQIYVDGFSGGKMPPKSSIRAIRINQNPYSSEYDTVGTNRIEIFTKPGGDAFHGDGVVVGSDSSFDSRNPYSPQRQPFYSTILQGDLSGPITKKSSFSVAAYQFHFDNSAIVNAVVLDPGFNQVPFTDAVASPTTTLSVNPRFDAQLSKNNTLTLRYQLDRVTQTNAGVGQFALASQGYQSRATTSTLQASDTEAATPHIVNELRFQYIRTRTAQNSVSSAPALAVQGSFTGGGNNIGDLIDNQDAYEIQNYLSIEHKKHFFRFGVRERLNRDSNRSTADYNGQYTFSTLTAYQLTVQGLAAGLSPAAIRASGGGASQFDLTAGVPSASILVADTGLYADDTWKARDNLTLSYGLRFETQNYIPNRADFAPRLGFAYGIRGTAKKPAVYTLRGGFGIFYNRLPSTNILTAVRQNGISQQQYVLTSPDTYPNVPPPASLSSVLPPTIFRISPGYTSPYLLQSGITLDRSLGKYGSVSGSYTYGRGVHQLLSRNINAPLPGTFNPADPTSGVRPLGGLANLYQYESTGLSRQNRLTVNARISNGEKFQLFANYFYAHYNTDTSGGFPSNQYNIGQDYGRATTDIRNRLFLGIFGQLPFHINGGPFLFTQSSSPFNIVLGQDLNGDSQFNDRPSFATDLTRPSVIQTRFGNFDTLPIAGQRLIPINYGNGPGLFYLNAYLGRAFHIGPILKPPAGAPPPPPPKPGTRPTPPERQYTLEFGVEGNNIFNHNNPAPPVGVLGSPLFGQSNALSSFFTQGGSANRIVSLTAQFRF